MKFRDLNDENIKRNIKNGVYTNFFARSNEFDDVDIVCNNKNKKVMTSFRFSSVIPTLREYFGIPDSKDKEGKKFDEICRNLTLEKDRILNLHSSALLALLFFYKVNDENKLTIKEVTYNDVLFEVKNAVFRGGPSQVDVLLISKDKTALLFLESKFTELDEQANKTAKRGKPYKDYYEQLSPYLVNKDKKSLEPNKPKLVYYENEDKDVVITSGDSNNKRYYEGITQMIAHFIGLCKGPSGNKSSTYAKSFKSAKYLFLGEILFKFPNNMTEINGIIEDYMELYNGLAEVLNKPITKEKFKEVNNLKNNRKNNIDKILVLDKALTYQGLLKDNPDYELDDKVKEFYQF